MPSMGARIASLAIAAGLSACARPNSEFGDAPDGTTSSGDTGMTGGASVADATTRASTSKGTGSSTSDPSEGVDSTEDSSSTSHGSEAESTSEIATDTQVGPANLLWISALVMGDWETLDNDPCAMALLETGATCVNAPVVLVGRTNAPLTELPSTFAFLGNAPFYAATTGDLVLESLDDLLSGTVGAAFVDSLTSADPSPDLYAWRGPLDGEPASTCENWLDPEPNGTYFFFEAGSPVVSTAGLAPCSSELRLLCACAAVL